MLKKMLFILLLAGTIGCKKEDPKPPVTCMDDSEMDPLYLAAAKLYLFQAMSVNPNEANSIRINEEKLNGIYKALKAIKTLPVPEVDTVFNMYRVPYKNYIPGELQDFVLQTWDTAVVREIITGEKAFREATTHYGLYLVRTEEPPAGSFGGPWSLHYKSCKLVNPLALNTITNPSKYSFTSTTISPGINSGMNVHITSAGKYTFTFTAYGFNSSLNRYQQRFWDFEVDAGFNARFVVALGDPAPPL